MYIFDLPLYRFGGKYLIFNPCFNKTWTFGSYLNRLIQVLFHAYDSYKCETLLFSADDAVSSSKIIPAIFIARHHIHHGYNYINL